MALNVERCILPEPNRDFNDFPETEEVRGGNLMVTSQNLWGNQRGAGGGFEESIS